MQDPGVPAYALIALFAGALWLFWRCVWFWRNPPRTPPATEGAVSAADGKVMYVKKLVPGEDIIGEQEPLPRLVIGVFMSPFDVHYNRAPLSGEVQSVRHHPGRSVNLQNERTVTLIHGRLHGETLPCYVVQIAATAVDGIDSYVVPGDRLDKGSIFGMIRIGSQVDVVVPWHEGLNVRVRPGDRVRAGETLLFD